MVTAEELQSMLLSHTEGHPTNVSVPPGWMDLVAECHQQLVRIYPEYKLSQIKEKFGGLRYYVGPIPSSVFELFYATIKRFEDKSYQTCQACGEPGQLLVIGRWYYTLCQADEDATREWRKGKGKQR
jgi:hypothetical protein